MTSIPNLSNLRSSEVSTDDEDYWLGWEESYNQWEGFSWNQLQNMLVEESKDWVGSVGLLVAILKHVAEDNVDIESLSQSLAESAQDGLNWHYHPNWQKWEWMNVALGNTNFKYNGFDGSGSQSRSHIATQKRTLSEDAHLAYKEMGLNVRHPLEGLGLNNVNSMGHNAFRTEYFDHYLKRYFGTMSAVGAISKLGVSWLTKLESYPLLDRQVFIKSRHYAKQKTARYILDEVVLKQKRFVLEALMDYPTLFTTLPNALMNDPEVQMEAGLRGVPEAAIAALRSMLLVIGLEKPTPGLVQRLHAYFLKKENGDSGPSVKEYTFSYANGLFKAAVSLARANPKNNDVQRMADDLVSFLNQPGGEIQKYDEELYKRDFGELESDSESDDSILPKGKRHKNSIASLAGYFGEAKVQEMQLRQHTVRFADARVSI